MDACPTTPVRSSLTTQPTEDKILNASLDSLRRINTNIRDAIDVENKRMRAKRVEAKRHASWLVAQLELKMLMQRRNVVTEEELGMYKREIKAAYDKIKEYDDVDEYLPFGARVSANPIRVIDDTYIDPFNKRI